MKNTLLLLIISFGVSLLACKSEKTAQTTDSETTETEMTEKDGQKYTLTPFSPSPEFKDAQMTSMTFTDGKFEFGIGGESYKLGEQTPDAPQKMCANSGKGQHIHLIVDDAPYAAKYTSSFDYEIEDGEHYILAFLSRSYHESIKTDQAHIVKKAMIEANSIKSEEDVTDPMLFYSRPKGTYLGKDTKKVMLDFYLKNVSLDSAKVEADINGEKHLLDTWQPYYVEGLPMGDNTITLTLMDKDGNKMDSPLNPVSRTFTLKEDPTPEK
jgi:hypothetical protein